MLDAATLRALALFGPILLWSLLAITLRPQPRTQVGAWLSIAWALPALTACDQLAQHFDWWQYHAEGGLLLGMPADLWLGWAILWGPVPALALNRAPAPAPSTTATTTNPGWHWLTQLALAAGLLLFADGYLMPASAAVLTLGPHWLLGELLCLLVVLIPAQILARLTAEDRAPAVRATLQMLAFGGLILGVFSALTLEQSGAQFTAWQTRGPRWNSVLLQLIALPGLAGLSAVQEFAERGRGTPLPYDPPKQLVSSGLYAYVANPMQLSMTVFIFGWGWFLHNPLLMLGAALATAFSSGLAAWHEQAQLIHRFGPAWNLYRQHVRRWWPCWRPWHPSLNNPAVSPACIYLAETCPHCSAFARWLIRHTPTALQIIPAEDHPSRDLHRATYDPRDGSPEVDGLNAVARALEHIHLSYALAGAFMRLPLIRPVLQIFADAFGAGPQTIKRRPAAPVAHSSPPPAP